MSQLYDQEYQEAHLADVIPNYADGHLGMVVECLLELGPLSNDWWPHELMAIEGWAQDTIESAPESNVVACNRPSRKQIQLLVTLLGGRCNTIKLEFDLEIPRLSDKVCGTANANAISGDPIALEDEDADLCRTTLDCYVDTNRLHSQFVAALAMFHQCTLTPVPDTAEGTWGVAEA